jgi:F-type H+-transporting ATPase subunit delta
MTHLGDQGAGSRVDSPARQDTVLDVNLERIARVYAEALFRAAESRGQSDAILEELDSLVQDVLRADPAAEAFLASGAIGRDRKAAVIRTTFGNRASELFLNFLLVLNDHERLDVLRPIAAAYRELRDERAGRLFVFVQSALRLPEDQQEQLKRQLRETFRKEPILQTQIDPELLGGLVVRVGDWLFDRSVRTELENIRNQIIARSSYEIQSGRDRFRSPDGN